MFWLFFVSERFDLEKGSSLPDPSHQLWVSEVIYPQHSLGFGWHCCFSVKDLKGLKNRTGEMVYLVFFIGLSWGESFLK